MTDPIKIEVTAAKCTCGADPELNYNSAKVYWVRCRFPGCGWAGPAHFDMVKAVDAWNNVMGHLK